MTGTSDHAPQLDPRLFARVREIFSEASDLPQPQRAAFVLARCADEPAVRDAVLGLLAADERSDAALDPDSGALRSRVLGVSAAALENIGPYRIRAVIGQGGMGIVYLAQQTNPHREVALKIVRRGNTSPSAQSRFAREVRVLGRLEHPGITRIYEAGTAETTDGPVAYFAMEYVRGPRLIEAVEAMKLDAPARVELVAKLADAVQHAHTKGVIHRDLKPANILVDDESGTTQNATGPGSATLPRISGPQPKILDFGVARLLEPDTQHTAITEAGLVIGTVAYMSPEQLSGDADAIDARSDVYAIGVILYELLTGRMPLDTRGKPLAEAARIVRDQTPSPLNSPRNTTGLHLDRDLETIALRAMAKERDRRYPTAAALADDLRRFLRNEPIQARAPTTLYQITKFAQRNRALVTGLAVASLAVVGGLVVSTSLYFKEQRAREHADAKDRLNSAVRGYMIENLLLAAGPERMGYDVKMLDVLSKASEGLHERFPDAPDIEGSIRMDLGSVLNQIGKFQESKAQCLAAIPLIEKVSGHDSLEAIQAVLLLSVVHQDLKEDTLWLETASDALARCRRSLPPGHLQTIHALSQVGGALVTLRRYEDALPIIQEGLAAAQLDPKTSAEPMGGLLEWLTACQEARGETEQALESRRKTLQFVQEHYGPDNRNTLVVRSNLVNALVKSDHVDEALSAAQGLQESINRLFPPGHPNRAHAGGTIGRLLARAGRYPEAETVMLDAYEISASNAKEFDWTTEQRIHQLRWLYSIWPGHEKELTTWCVQGVKGRLMLAHANELQNLPDVIGAVLKQFGDAGISIDRARVLDLVWERRDELAPQGHPRRAAFYANLARAGVVEHRPDHSAESLSLAEASLPYATEAQVASELIAAAHAMTDQAARR